MTQYHSVNGKLSNLEFRKMEICNKNATDITLRLSSKIIGANETNSPHNLLLKDMHVLSLCKPFVNNSSVNVKLSKLDYPK